MADHAVDEYGDDVFIYRGGRRTPQHITHARIDESVDEIEGGAFICCRNLLTVDTHDGIRRVGKDAFSWCESLRRINLKSAVEIDHNAFYKCENLESVEFGVRLETIGGSAFSGCTSITHLKLPSVITIEMYAFENCKRLTDIELSERLETIERRAFAGCESLQRIAIPLKRNLFEFNHYLHRYNQFDACEQLTSVHLVGGAHETVASLHMERWRTEMIAEINRINQVLPYTSVREKTDAIHQWMNSVMDKLVHYKLEHYRYVKEGITLLELALWKAKLDEKDDDSEEGRTEKAKVDAGSYRRNKRITCGADIVIKNVLPFLKLN